LKRPEEESSGRFLFGLFHHEEKPGELVNVPPVSLRLDMLAAQRIANHIFIPLASQDRDEMSALAQADARNGRAGPGLTGIGLQDELHLCAMPAQGAGEIPVFRAVAGGVGFPGDFFFTGGLAELAQQSGGAGGL